MRRINRFIYYVPLQEETMPDNNPSSLAWMLILLLMGGSAVAVTLVFVVLILTGVLSPGTSTGVIP